LFSPLVEPSEGRQPDPEAMWPKLSSLILMQPGTSLLICGLNAALVMSFWLLH
jgi:hypothetical protein